MKEKILITSVLLFSKDNEYTTRITYLLVGKDRLSNNSNYKGYTEITSFVKGEHLFNSITLDFIGKPIDANFQSRIDYKNPLNVKNILQSIDLNGTIINIL